MINRNGTEITSHSESSLKGSYTTYHFHKPICYYFPSGLHSQDPDHSARPMVTLASTYSKIVCTSGLPLSSSAHWWHWGFIVQNMSRGTGRQCHIPVFKDLLQTQLSIAVSSWWDAAGHTQLHTIVRETPRLWWVTRWINNLVSHGQVYSLYQDSITN
jgi:hypothetical protein